MTPPRPWADRGWGGSGVFKAFGDDGEALPAHPLALVTCREVDRLVLSMLTPTDEWEERPPSREDIALLFSQRGEWVQPSDVERRARRSHADPETTGGCPVLAGWMRPGAVDDALADMAWRLAGAYRSDVEAAQRRVDEIHDTDTHHETLRRRSEQGVTKRSLKRWCARLLAELRARDAARRAARNEAA